MRTLILSNGKPGHTNQARALCGIMDWQGQEVGVQPPFRIGKGVLDIFIITALS